MFDRQISVKQVAQVLKEGKVIAEYLNDKPYPSFLLFGFANLRPLHLVVAKEPETELCIVITAYVPDPKIWNDTFDQKIEKS